MLEAFLFALAIGSASPSPAPARIVTVEAPRATLHLEVADTQPTREHGLMDRTLLPKNTGMLFVFDSDADVEFWMKDTRIPLDMVFVAEDGTVRAVAARVPVVPLTTPDASIPRRRARAKFVVELPAGEAARDGIRPGTAILGISIVR
ncbi:MAG: DUF192 domain-containing protein [Candidatus Eremiobacteraeota bacterium]|nr:DUF192 domain-containing protein [Candidatus Eremiobacteraeota bacterium]